MRLIQLLLLILIPFAARRADAQSLDSKLLGNPSLVTPSLTDEIRDSNGQTYRLVEANHFEMGAKEWADFRVDHVSRPTEDARPTFPVILTRPFYVATTEITVGQFRKFVDATEYVTDAEKSTAEQGKAGEGTEKPTKGSVGWAPVDDDRGRPKTSFRVDTSFTWKNPGFPQSDAHPVVGVSYHDAKAYCRWLGKLDDANYRLPTEAEWECTCRAGAQTHFSFGDEYRDQFYRHANMADIELEKKAQGRTTHQWLIDMESNANDGHAFTSPVKSFQPNPWGLYDMHGNAWEWCEDRYLDTWYQRFKQASHGKVRERAIDPLCTEKWNEHGQWQVIRGGSWFLAPLQCRSSSRGVFNARDSACYVGFRVVRDVAEDVAQQFVADHEISEAALATLMASAKEAREYDDNTIRLEFTCDQLADENPVNIIQQLTKLNYEIDVTIRPPGTITSETIAKFAGIRHLVGFVLATNCSDISDKTFAMLFRHPRLRRLQITGSGNLTDEHVFHHLRECDQLKELSLQGDGITDDGLLQLPALKHLQTLHLSSTKSNGESLKRFDGSPLEQVSLQNMTDEAALQLAMFPVFRHLSAPNSPLTRCGLESIVKLSRIYAIDLVNCSQITDEDFALLGRLPALQQLSLQETAAGDRAMSALAESLSLRQLRLGSENLTDRGMHDLCRIVGLQELTLTKETTSITDDAFRDFWRLANLQTLSLDAPYVTGASFATLAELPRLRRIFVQGEGLTDAACEHLAHVESLTELTIGDRQRGGPTGLTDAGLLQLAESQSLKKLTIIRKGTTITDEGAGKLKELMDGVQVEIR